MRRRQPARRQPARRQSLLSESLEPRLMLSSDGAILGADARLTLSFAPDGTSVAGESSALFAQLDAMAPREHWQAAIVEGFQAWASQTNGDIGVTTDDGSDFGVPGRNRHDPRFGDIRIGSIPLDDELLATSVSAAEVIDGTWTGDVFFNSDAQFKSLDDVFALALHEAGHVFGLEHSEDPLSPMYEHGIPTSTTPTAEDIMNLQQVFGERAHDIYDMEAGGDAAPIELKHFTWLDLPKGTAPTVVFGDITDFNDQDEFYVEVFDGYAGSITFELVVSELSQLAPRIVITGPDDFEFVSVMAAGVDGLITVHDVTASDRFDIQIDASIGASSAIGGYTLMVWFNADNDPASTPAAYDLARVPIRYLDQEELGEYFVDGGQLLANDDDGENNAHGSEIELETAPGFEDGTRYLQYASIDAVGDVDRYQVKSPEFVLPGRDWARFSLRSMEAASFSSDMMITDDSGDPVQFEYLVRNAEFSIVQFGPVVAEQTYFLEVSAASHSQSPTGNYELDAIFARTLVERDEFVSGQLTSQNDAGRFVLRQRRPQLFHFNFAVDAAAGDVLLRMRIVDAAGHEVKRIEAAGGDVQTAAVFLPESHYRVIVDVVSGSFSELNYRISGSAVDDPLGPTSVDPSGFPFDFEPERVAIHLASIFGI